MGPGPTGPAFTPTFQPSSDRDLLHWSFWWYMESARYLDLRTHIQGPAAPDGRSVLLNAPLAPSRQVVRTRVMPRLLEILGDDAHFEVTSSALIAVGRLARGDSALEAAAFRAIRPYLAGDNVKVRESALLALGLMASHDGIVDLIDVATGATPARTLLETDSIPGRTRAFAAHALGLAAHRAQDLGERQRIALALTDVLEAGPHGTDSVPVAAISALGLVDLGARIVIPAEDLRQHAGIDRVLSGRSLAAYLETWVMPSREVQASRTTRIRSHAAIAFARASAFAGKASREHGVELLTDLSSSRTEHGFVRASATIGLGEAARGGSLPADREARRQLLATIKSGQILEARFARMALATASSAAGAGDDPFAGWEIARNALTTELGRAKSADLGWTALALGVLESRLHDADIETGPAASRALATMAMRRKGDDDSAAIGIGLALAARGTDRQSMAGDRVMQEFDDTTTPLSKGYLALSLGLLDHMPAAQPLRDGLEKIQHQSPVLWNSAVSLGMMGETVSKDLVDALRESRSNADRVALAAALGQTGTAPSVGPLLEMLDAPSIQTSLRASAIDSLTAICDLERMPWRDPYSHAMPYFAATPTQNGSGNGSSILERPW